MQPTAVAGVCAGVAPGVEDREGAPVRYSRNRPSCDHCTELQAQIDYANRLLAYFMGQRLKQPTDTVVQFARGTEEFPRPPKIPTGSIVLGKRPRLERLEAQIAAEIEASCREFDEV